MSIERSKPFMDDYLPEQEEPADPELTMLNGDDWPLDLHEDDGQPSEYDEWQDYMGGDEYYDHSENEMW